MVLPGSDGDLEVGTCHDVLIFRRSLLLLLLV